MNYPKIVEIIDTKKENDNIKTITFKYLKETKPGQFFMIWVPRIDEIPMSISYINKDNKSITFKKIGDATEHLFKLKKGDKIGIRGPYGTNFKIKNKNILFVGGGTGIATLGPAIEQAYKQKKQIIIIIGTKTKKEIFFEKRFKKYTSKIYITTDDGSYGKKGYASDIVKKIIKEEQIQSIITCGPEKMMKKIYDISKDKYFQASLERYMKCGFGICGQCCIGEGLRVCKDGPVFDGKNLNNIEEFGKYKRDSSGKKIKI